MAWYHIFSRDPHKRMDAAGSLADHVMEPVIKHGQDIINIGFAYAFFKPVRQIIDPVFKNIINPVSDVATSIINPVNESLVKITGTLGKIGENILTDKSKEYIKNIAKEKINEYVKDENETKQNKSEYSENDLKESNEELENLQAEYESLSKNKNTVKNEKNILIIILISIFSLITLFQVVKK